MARSTWGRGLQANRSNRVRGNVVTRMPSTVVAWIVAARRTVASPERVLADGGATTVGRRTRNPSSPWITAAERSARAEPGVPSSAALNCRCHVAGWLATASTRGLSRTRPPTRSRVAIIALVAPASWAWRSERTPCWRRAMAPIVRSSSWSYMADNAFAPV